MNDHIPRNAHVFPASPGQERLWFLAQMNEAANTAYTLGVRITIEGTLDHALLQSALSSVVERHEALRTGLRHVDGALRQIVVPGISPSITVFDINARSYSDSEVNEKVERLISQEARRGWNLAEPPLMRALLLRLSESRHILVLCVHHAVCDGLSMQVLLRELLELYSTIDEILVPPSLQFADYVVWSLGGEHGKDPVRIQRRELLRNYWKETLHGAPDVLEIPADYRRPAVQTYEGFRVPIILEADFVKCVRDWSSAHEVTLSSTLLSAYVIVLARNAGVDDLLVGMPVANRNDRSIAETVGYFANTCPVRADLRADPTLEQLAQQLYRMTVGALGHADLPFSDLVDVLSPARMPERTPVFQVMFSFQQDVRREWDVSGMRVNIDDVDCGVARTDLSLFLFEDNSGAIDGFLECASALFSFETAERFADQLRVVLCEMLRCPQCPVSICALTEPRLSELDEAHIDGGELPPKEWALVWPRIQDVAKRQPHAEAVRDDNERLDYEDLVRRVYAIATCLGRIGVRDGDKVVVHISRSVNTVVAILACWQAGLVYVPMDPSGPLARRRTLLEHVAPTVIVCDDPEELPDGYRGRAFSLTDPRIVTKPLVVRSSVVDTRPEDPAYLMFTSGSTGHPKGVVVSHDNVALFLHAVIDRIGLDSTDRLLALTTTAFDISLLELLGPLVTGGTVIIAPESSQRDGADIAARLDARGLTLAQATPATWSLVLSSGWRASQRFKLLSGGEALPSDLADRLISTGAEVHNLYGPTETTIWSCEALVAADGSVTIGTPLPATRISIVDSDLQRVPVGVCGELLIGGAGVALGYLGEAAQTAERFLPDPTTPGERLYRTGDIARLRSDGLIQFVGRIDEQIKVRGHRIELGEIESALRSLSGVRESAAVASAPQGVARVSGYLVFEDSVSISPDDIRRELAMILPTPMIPNDFYRVLSIPLTPNGKTDRRALLGTGERLRSNTHRVAVLTDTQRAVAAIWRELLGVDDIDINDDFFALGGHSLLAADLLRRIEDDLQARVSMAEFFIEPTVARVANTVEQQRGRAQAELTMSDDIDFVASPIRDGVPDNNWSFPTMRRCVGAPSSQRSICEVTS